jgi:hypothetical protein
MNDDLSENDLRSTQNPLIGSSNEKDYNFLENDEDDNKIALKYNIKINGSLSVDDEKIDISTRFRFIKE